MTSKPSTNAHASVPLPEGLTVPGWRVGLIIASFSIALPGFLNGAQTALALGFSEAVLAALAAGIILCLGACFTAIISVRTRLTTYMLVQRSFGTKGAALVNLVIALIHFGWFGVNVSFFGDAMVAAAQQGYGVSGSFGTFVIVGSALITLSTIFGFRTLDRLALVSVPLLGAILIGVCIAAVGEHGVVLTPSIAPPVPLTFPIALSALIGGNMLTVATMPDLSRHIRTERGAIAGMALSLPFAAPLLMIVAGLIALATGETDIMKLVVGLGFGAPTLLILILSVWTINALNLYSAGLSLSATFPRARQWMFIVAGGVAGAILALMGIINAFVPFLLALGLIIPPIAAIYVIDGLVTFCGRDAAETIRDMPAVRWEAVGVWLGSLAVSLSAAHFGLTVTTVPALDATLLAAACYLALLRWRPHHG